MFRNREQQKNYQASWEKQNRERRLEYHRQWKINHPGVIEKSQHDFEERNREARKERRRTYYITNKTKMREQNRVQQQKWKRIILEKLGGICVCCGENEMDFLTLEHIYGDGGAHRATKKNIYCDVIRQGIPIDRYTVLCMNCNFAGRYGKTCPHKRFALRLIA